MNIVQFERRLGWGLLAALMVMLLCLASVVAQAQSASLLPNGMQQFSDANGVPYANGKVYFYTPNTSTPKTTWVDPNQGVANANPVVLDSAGRATIYGSGQYRQLVLDQFGNTVWDKLTYGQGILTVPPLYIGTIAALQALSTSGLSAGYAVGTSGYYSPGDAPAVVYTLSNSPCAGDGGSQIPALGGTQCWLLGAQSTYDVRNWGATGTIQATTGTIAASSNSLVVASASGYAVGQHIIVYGAGSATAVGTPTGVTLTTEGTAGAVAYHAQVVAIDGDHGYSVASSAGTGATGNAAQQVPQAGSDSQDQLIQWSAGPGPTPASYAIYDDVINTVPGSGALICRSVQDVTAWRDYGQSGECPSWVPTNPPGSTGKLPLRATITAINNTTLTLSASASTTVGGAVVEHDDTVPVQNALATETVVTMPCGNFRLTGGLTLTGTGATLQGQNKQCTTLQPSGAFEVATMGGGGTTYFSQTFENFQISALDMASGDCMFVQNTNRFIIDNIELNNCFNEMQMNNVFIGEVHDFFSSTRRRGDYGWWLWGGASGGGTQTGVVEIRHVNSATSFQGISFHMDGNVASLRARYLGLQTSPYQIVSNNAVGAAQTPTYGQFYDTGFNVCWRLCLNVTDGTLMQFYSPYIQEVNAGGANNFAVLISQVDNTVTPATGSVGFQIHGGTVFGGNDAIQDNGNGTVIDGVNVFSNYDAAIVCGAKSNGLTVMGGNTYNAPGNLATAAQDYGLKMTNGCANGTFIGTFVGNKAGVLNSTSPANEINLNGQIDPPTTSVVTGAAPTLTAASYPALYQGGTLTSIIEQSGSFAPQTDTTDTATNILGSMHNPQVGSTFRFILRNHNHKANPADANAVVTLAGGAGVTIAGTATVPDAANGALNNSGGVQSGLYTWREFRGTVTNVGAPAVTIYGCSQTAAGGC
jgi:hypothetical protein